MPRNCPCVCVRMNSGGHHHRRRLRSNCVSKISYSKANVVFQRGVCCAASEPKSFERSNESNHIAALPEHIQPESKHNRIGRKTHAIVRRNVNRPQQTFPEDGKASLLKLPCVGKLQNEPSSPSATSARHQWLLVPKQFKSYCQVVVRIWKAHGEVQRKTAVARTRWGVVDTPAVIRNLQEKQDVDPQLEIGARFYEASRPGVR